MAGIPLELEIDGGLRLLPEPAPAWHGSRSTDRPIVLRHVLGDTGRGDMREILAPSPSSTYFLDASGNVAVQFRSAVPQMPPVLMRTIRPGSDYEIRYAFPPPQISRRGRADFSAVAFALGQRRRGFFVHSCGFLLPGGAGVLCPGVSGTGKTTLSRLLMALDAGLELLSDDRTVVTDEDGELRLWGSPFPGEAGVAGEADGPLRVILFPRHGSTVDARPLQRRDAARRLRETIALPLWDPGQLDDALALLDRLVSTTILLEASYPPTADAARWLIDTITTRLETETP
jgi:hypothetical protein